MPKTWFVRGIAAVGAGALLAAGSACLHWPHQATSWKGAARVAVGMRTLLSPTDVMTVEVRDGSWIVVSLVPPNGPGFRTRPPDREQIIVSATEVRRWTAGVRARLGRVGDTLPILARPASGPVLGRGQSQLRWAGRWTAGIKTGQFARNHCGGGAQDGELAKTIDDLRSLLALLDSAAALARDSVPKRPSLERPYYASEVSCGPRPRLANVPAKFPASIPEADRRPTAIGVQFIVDTAGQVEPHSLDVLPGTDPQLAAAAEAAIMTWSFQPADWNGIHVRSIVQTSVPFDEYDESPPTVRIVQRMEVHPDDDGWVRVFVRGPPLATDGLHEWFTPDQVDRWVSQGRAMTAAAAEYNRGARSVPFAMQRDSVMRRLLPGGRANSYSADLGVADGVRFSVAASIPSTPTALAVVPSLATPGALVQIFFGIITCGGSSNGGTQAFDSTAFDRLAAASRAARARHATPITATAATYTDRAQVHAANDVACPSWIPWRHLANGMYVYPANEHPASMAGTSARAEVLASFVVDATGTPDSATLRVMAHADPRAVAALAASLPSLQLPPATRGGERVQQLVIQSFVFEPPAVCLNPRAAPVCPD